MSFNKRLFSMDSFMAKPKKRRNGNGRNGKSKKRNGNGNGRGSARSAALGFEAPGFFKGLETGNNIPRIGESQGREVQGLQIPELGEGFNSRFGKIGTGFIEQTNTFKVGFSDVLTANGRTGQILGEGGKIGSRGRGRPRGSGKGRKATASKTTVDSSKKSVGAILGGAASKGIKGGISRIRARASRGEEVVATSQFSQDEIQAEKGVDKANVAQLQAGLQKEIEEQDMDMTEEEVEEEDEEVLDKEMSNEEGVNGQK